MSKNAMKAAGVLLGTTLMSASAAVAADARCGAGKCGSSMGMDKKVEEKVGNGRCGTEKADEKLEQKMNHMSPKAVEKKAEEKMGQGRCGASK